MAYLASFDPNQPFLRDPRLQFKAYGELVVFVIQLLRSYFFRHDPRVDRLVRFVSRTAEQYDLAGLVRHEPSGLTILALMEELNHLVAGTRGSYYDQLVAMVKAGYTRTMERPPFRKLEVRYSLDRAQIPHDMEDVNVLFQRTAPGRAPLVPFMTDTDMYTVTHVVMYLTDMGHRPASVLVPEAEDYLRWLVRVLLGVCVMDADLDLTGELLMCAGALDMGSTATTRLAWRTLIQNQQDDGSIPGRHFSLGELTALPGDAHSHYVFSRCYHTTLVCLGAALVWMNAVQSLRP
jgi:hypothetical protein